MKTEETAGKNGKFKKRQANLNDNPAAALSEGDVLNESTRRSKQNKSVARSKDEFFPITKQDGGTELNNESIKYVDQTENQERFSSVKYGGINTGDTIRSS